MSRTIASGFTSSHRRFLVLSAESPSLNGTLRARMTRITGRRDESG
jgi:hypothetical protein